MKVRTLILLVTLSVTLLTIKADDLFDVDYFDQNYITINDTNNNNKNSPPPNQIPEFLVNRIMGGDQVSNITEFCYQIGMKVKVGDQYGWCGGFLISHTVIVTAAHCFKGESYLVKEGTLYMGVINRDEPEPGSVLLNFTSSDYIIHDMWDDKLKSNDIAVIILKKPIQFSERICSIDLVSYGLSKESLENKTGIISGWGRSSDAVNNYEPFMKTANVRVMNLDECHNKLWQVTSTNICVHTEFGVGACKGDSGGPLVFYTNNKNDRASKRVYGVTSFTSRGCVQNFPRVYTNVAEYKGWICKHTGICEIMFPDD